MRGWRDFGVVETIYEEDYENSSISSFLSPCSSSPPSPLHSRVQSWSVEMGRKPDVLIHVMGTCFHLHKDPLTSKSIYLQRHLTEPEVILSPPLSITAETFTVIADFCYGNQISITPINVAALMTAAELLEMTEPDGDGDENLVDITETYFRQVVAGNHEYAAIVFRSCLDFLPDVEKTATLVCRCVEAVAEEDDDASCFRDVGEIGAAEFQKIVESMRRRFTRHDALYRFVDLYLKVGSGKLTEEQRTQICNSIDCNKLTPNLLIHAVQNPRLPLRFIVRAMLIEQLNTRRSIYSSATDNHHNNHRHHRQQTTDPLTLGAILQRDAALRQVAQLKSAMNATNSRIQTLEKELTGMKKLLHESEKQNSVLIAGRSASFHYGSSNKIERGERGSTSSASLRFCEKRDVVAGGGESSFSEGNVNGSPRLMQKNIRRRLINGLKNALRGSNRERKIEEHGFEDDGEDFLVIRKNLFCNR